MSGVGGAGSSHFWQTGLWVGFVQELDEETLEPRIVMNTSLRTQNNLTERYSFLSQKGPQDPPLG